MRLGSETGTVLEVTASAAVRRLQRIGGVEQQDHEGAGEVLEAVQRGHQGQVSQGKGDVLGVLPVGAD